MPCPAMLGEGRTAYFDDPYRRSPTMGEMDLHLLGEGRHERLWQRLGANVRVHKGLSAFGVWAPRAKSVRVVRDLNGWDGRVHPMRVLGGSGDWEIFLPGVRPGARYKYEIVTQDGHHSLRADPFSFAAEVPPATASIVTRGTHDWQDARWIAERATVNLMSAPVSIYECHLGSWRRTWTPTAPGVR